MLFCMTDDELIGTKEAARLLDRDKSIVTRYAHDGRLPFQKLPGRNGVMLFKRADVLRLKEELGASA